MKTNFEAFMKKQINEHSLKAQEPYKATKELRKELRQLRKKCATDNGFDIVEKQKEIAKEDALYFAYCNFKALLEQINEYENMENTDTVGNPLPKFVWLRGGASREEIAEANAMTSFLLACSIALGKGNTVIYDKPTKTAISIDEKNNEFILSHP